MRSGQEVILVTLVKAAVWRSKAPQRPSAWGVAGYSAGALPGAFFPHHLLRVPAYRPTRESQFQSFGQFDPSALHVCIGPIPGGPLLPPEMSHDDASLRRPRRPHLHDDASALLLG